MRYAKTATGFYREPGVESSYRGAYTRGQALRLLDEPSQKTNGYVRVQPVDGQGQPNGEPGWVYAGHLKAQTENLDSLSRFREWVNLGAPMQCEQFPSRGPRTCLGSLRRAFGMGSMSQHAKDVGPYLVRAGFNQRGGDEDIAAGDWVVYGGDDAHYKGGGSGHVGIAVPWRGKLWLWSHTTWNGRTGWQLTPLYDPKYSFYRD